MKPSLLNKPPFSNKPPFQKNKVNFLLPFKSPHLSLEINKPSGGGGLTLINTHQFCLFQVALEIADFPECWLYEHHSP